MRQEDNQFEASLGYSKTLQLKIKKKEREREERRKRRKEAREGGRQTKDHPYYNFYRATTKIKDKAACGGTCLYTQKAPGGGSLKQLTSCRLAWTI